MAKKMKPIHPGEHLREDFMKPLRLSANRLAMDLHVPATRIGEILAERRGITADTAIRLGLYFKMSPEFWLRLQMRYDLDVAEDENIGEIKKQVRAIQAIAP
jgi:antitoxin HigA-1